MESPVLSLRPDRDLIEAHTPGSDIGSFDDTAPVTLIAAPPTGRQRYFNPNEQTTIPRYPALGRPGHCAVQNPNGGDIDVVVTLLPSNLSLGTFTVTTVTSENILSQIGITLEEGESLVIQAVDVAAAPLTFTVSYQDVLLRKPNEGARLVTVHDQYAATVVGTIYTTPENSVAMVLAEARGEQNGVLNSGAGATDVTFRVRDAGGVLIYESTDVAVVAATLAASNNVGILPAGYSIEVVASVEAINVFWTILEFDTRKLDVQGITYGLTHGTIDAAGTTEVIGGATGDDVPEGSVRRLMGRPQDACAVQNPNAAPITVTPQMGRGAVTAPLDEAVVVPIASQSNLFTEGGNPLFEADDDFSIVAVGVVTTPLQFLIPWEQTVI